MRFNYTIYVPGTTLNTTDTLLRFLLSGTDSSVPDIYAYVASVISAVPIHDAARDDVKWQRQPTVFCKILRDIANQHGQRSRYLSPEVHLYVYSKKHLTVCERLVMYDAHIVIPSSLRARFFEALHDRRQSTVKSRAKTREAMWWPKIRVDIEDYITACAT